MDCHTGWLSPTCALLLIAGCGSSGKSATAAPKPARSAAVTGAPLPTEPVEVALVATRVGAAMRLDIHAVGRGAYEYAPFENPAGWVIKARQRGNELAHLVNGSVKIDRRPAGTAQWDTQVRFTVVFEVDEHAGDVAIEVQPPDGPSVEQVFQPNESP